MKHKSKEPLVYSSFPRRRESRYFKNMDARLRGNDGKDINQSFPKIIHLLLAATLIYGSVLEAFALENTITAIPPQAIFTAKVVDDEVLGRMRGGYLMPNGLVVSFGLERMVYINGTLSSATVLTVTDLGQIRGGSTGRSKALPVGAVPGLIQNGAGNIVGDMAASGGFATIIQNSADNQRIQTITTINTRVNSLEMMRSGRFGESLRDSLTFR